MIASAQRLIGLLLPCLLAAGSTQAAISDATLDAATAAVTPQVIEWRRDLHRNPELGNREFRTAKLVATELKSLGFEVRTGVAHTGVVGVLRGAKPGPTIALRADMDALPVTEETELPFKSIATSEYRGEKVGVMHACGHDGHTAILLGVARVLAGVRTELPGTVLFIFQPAEEGAPEGELGGAPLMLEQGLFGDPKPEAVFGLHLFAWHNVGTIGYRSGPYLAAADTFKVVVHGKQAHGGVPWAGVDPIVTASQIVLGLQTIVSRQVNIANYPAIVSVGAIKGGVRNNIIPEQVELVGTIRTFDTAVRADIIERIKRTATQIAAAAGATADFELGADPNPVVINDKDLTARVVPSLERAAGAGNVSVVPYLTVAEDFAYYAERVPSFYFAVGVTPPGIDAATAPSNHSSRFFLDEASLPKGLRAMLAVAVDYLQGPPAP
jgi:amidohydrolase